MILMLRCDCKIIPYQESIAQNLIEGIVGVVKLFWTKCRVNETPKCVLWQAFCGWND